MKDSGIWSRQRWEWEKTSRVVVFTVDEQARKDVDRVISELRNVLTEFQIPLDVINGNYNFPQDLPQIQCLFKHSLISGKIDDDKLNQELLNVREKGEIPYGVVLLVDKNKYEFSDPEAIYGIGLSDGLLILRCSHIEAIRHEFGHMLGLSVHHSGCVMQYKCYPGTTPKFCNDCRREIENMWCAEIEKGRLEGKR